MDRKQKTLLIAGVAALGVIGVSIWKRKEIASGVSSLAAKVRNYVFDKLVEGKLSQLHPEAQPYFREFVKRAQDKGWTVHITSGYRDASKQKEIKEQGSDFAVRPGNSYHNYGMAIDINLYKGNWKNHIKMASSKAEWEATGVPAIARELGIRWGGDFKGKEKGDHVHFDKPLKPMAELHQLAKSQYGSNVLDWKGNEIKLT